MERITRKSISTIGIALLLFFIGRAQGCPQQCPTGTTWGYLSHQCVPFPPQCPASPIEDTGSAGTSSTCGPCNCPVGQICVGSLNNTCVDPNECLQDGKQICDDGRCCKSCYMNEDTRKTHCSCDPAIPGPFGGIDTPVISDSGQCPNPRCDDPSAGDCCDPYSEDCCVDDTDCSDGETCNPKGRCEPLPPLCNGGTTPPICAPGGYGVYSPATCGYDDPATPGPDPYCPETCNNPPAGVNLGDSCRPGCSGCVYDYYCHPYIWQCP